MAYSINRRPLLSTNDSEFEDNIGTDIDDSIDNVPDEKPFFKPREPHDKYNFTYFAFYLLGMNTLIPWSFYITADEYWMYKFRDIHENHTNINFTFESEVNNKTDLQAGFTSYINAAGALPNTFFLILNVFIINKISLSVRMIGSQLIIIALFIMTTVLVGIDTDEWQSIFLIITLVSVGIINACCAVFGGSLMGIVGHFSPKYITAMSGGQALGCIFTALTEICSLWIGVSPVISGLIYFIIGDAILILSAVAFIIMKRTTFYKHHTLAKSTKPLESDCSVSTNEISFSQGCKISRKRILKRTWHYGISMFFTFFITFAVYPAVTVLVESQDKGKGHSWSDIYFVPVVTYLVFSVGDYTGRILAGCFQWPRSKKWLVIILSILRIGFVPALMLCNAQPRHHFPVYIFNDLYYILITVAFAITNGYLCNIVFILTLTVVNVEEKEMASMLMGAFLGVGIASGAALGLYLVKAL